MGHCHSSEHGFWHRAERHFEFMARRGGPRGFPFGGGGPFGGRGGDGFRMGRMVADGDLRLIVLSLIEKTPRHGYDLIKAIEDITSGFYSPSPGVIYPTLTFLDEAGYASASSEGSKKVYAITEAGRSYLAGQRDSVENLLAHLERLGKRMAMAREWFGHGEPSGRGETADRDIPDAIPELNEARRALKRALASKIGTSADEQRRIADILRRATAEVEKPDVIDV